VNGGTDPGSPGKPDEAGLESQAGIHAGFLDILLPAAPAIDISEC